MQPKRVTASVELESLIDKSGHGSSQHDVAHDTLPHLRTSSDASLSASAVKLVMSHKNEEAESSLKKPKPMTPIPYLQVFFIAIWRMSQSLFFLVIMPFINDFLVNDLKVADEVHVGNFSGLVETFA